MNGKYLAKYFGYPLQDFTAGTSIFKTLSFLRKSQYWDDNKIHDYQLNKLKALVDYTKSNVPYYEKLFKQICLSSDDIRSLDDIYKIPILTKQIVREQGNNLVSREYDKFKVKKGKTGGTTGAPTITYSDSVSRSFVWGSYFRWHEWMGINYFDKTATLWGARTVLNPSVIANCKLKLINYVQNKLTIDSFKLNQQTMPFVYTKLVNHHPSLLKGYLSSLVNFAEFIEKKQLTFPKLTALSSTTETLLPHNRVYLEKVFNAPIFDQYGCGEVSGISYECSKHKGLHINQEHVLLEILNEENVSIKQNVGRVVVTDLDNYVMPFIRFDNGDMAKLSPHKCTCGVNQPLMDSIEGRAIDTIQLKDGTKVHGVFFTDILYELNILTDKVQRFQIVQSKAGEISLNIEKGSGFDNNSKSLIKNSLMQYFYSVTIIVSNRIENEENGKFLYVKTKINTIN